MFRQQKTGGDVFIPFDRDLPDFASGFSNDLGYLQSSICAQPHPASTWITTRTRSPRSQKSVSQWFAKQVRKAGIQGKTAHGLRKSRAIALAEAEATSTQIGAWTGHESLTEIERYIRKYNRRKVLS